MSGRSEKEKMLGGEAYRPSDPELMADTRRAEIRLQAYAMAYPAASPEQRGAMLAELLGAVGAGAVVRPPFHCDYAYNIDLGREVFVNAGCIFLDVCAIRIGAACQIGPGVQILTADHPRDAVRRRAGLESGIPVQIGENVWIGGGAIILPGVRIGNDAVIGAGSVVIRDVAAGSTVVGNPARQVQRSPAG